MTDKKELRDRDLEKVSGGVAPSTLDITTVNLGDCFNAFNDTFYIARATYTNITKETPMEFDMYYDDLNYDSFVTQITQTISSLEFYSCSYDTSRRISNYIPR